MDIAIYDETNQINEKNKTMMEAILQFSAKNFLYQKMQKFQSLSLRMIKLEK